MQRGPISCGIAVPDSLEDYTSGVYCDDTGDLNIVHDISVVGYGVTDDGEKYWTVRNSWGTQYGEDGFVRVCRGVNNLAIESNCSWATPTDTWTEGVRHITTDAEKEDPLNDQEVYDFPQPRRFDTDLSSDKAVSDSFMPKTKAGCRVEEASFDGPEIITGPRPWERLSPNDIPTSVDWRDMNGKNYLSWNKN